MIRLATLLTLGIMAAAGTGAPMALAETRPPGHFAFVPVKGGVLRLDSESGLVTLCGGEPGSYACKPVDTGESGAAAGAALMARVAALESRLARLESAGLAAGEPPPKAGAIDRVGALADRAIRRLLGLMRAVKRDISAGVF